MEFTNEVREGLSAPVPAKDIQSMGKGGASVRFTSDKFVMHRLDDVVGPEGWQDDYVTVSYTKPYTKTDRRGNVTTYNGTMTCHLKVLGIMKSASADIELTNTPEGGSQTYGTPATNAQAKCFKRAAMKFGIAAELWNKDEPVVDDDDEDDRPVRRTAPARSGKTVSLSAAQAQILLDKGFKKADVAAATTFDIVGDAIALSKKEGMQKGDTFSRKEIEGLLAGEYHEEERPRGKRSAKPADEDDDYDE